MSNFHRQTNTPVFLRGTDARINSQACPPHNTRLHAATRLVDEYSTIKKESQFLAYVGMTAMFQPRIISLRNFHFLGHRPWTCDFSF